MRERALGIMAVTAFMVTLTGAAPVSAAANTVAVCHFPNHQGDYLIDGDAAGCKDASGRVLRLSKRAANLHLWAADDGPNCVASATDVNLGDVSGDTNSGNSKTVTSTICQGEVDWYMFRLVENDTVNDKDLTVRVTLTPVPGDVDLCLYADNAGGVGALLGCSTAGAGTTDLLQQTVKDHFGADDTTVFHVKAYHWSGAASLYTLEINGNV